MSNQNAIRSMYKNASLDPASTAIRLLELTDDGSIDIACKFHLYRLEEAPEYSAVSYTWGSTKDPMKVVVNGCLISVRRNLWQFLRRAKETQDRKVIWIDALCIDQNNVKERDSQAQMMGKIYSSVRYYLPFQAYTN